MKLLSVVLFSKAFAENFFEVPISLIETTTVLSLIVQLFSKVTLNPDNTIPQFDSIRTIPYLIEGDTSDPELISELRNCDMNSNVEELLTRFNTSVHTLQLDYDLRDLFRFEVDESTVFLLLVPSAAGESHSRRSARTLSRRSLQTPSEHSHFVGISTPAKVFGSDGQSITETGSINMTTITRQVQILSSQYTKAFEFLCSTAVQYLLPSVLGIEFCLRDPEIPSRSLNDKNILELVRRARELAINPHEIIDNKKLENPQPTDKTEVSAKVENIAEESRQQPKDSKSARSKKKKKPQLSEECDIYGYVDYFNESRIEITEDRVPILVSVGQPDLNVRPPLVPVSLICVRYAENL